MKRVAIPFIGDHSTGRSSAVNSQLLKNMYIERQDQTAKSPAVLYPTPGLTFLFSSGTGPCRSNGLIFKEKAYFISGADLVEFDGDLNQSTKGQLNTNNGWVSMTANPDEIFIADGTNGYTFDGTTLTVVSDADYPDTASHVAFMDSYFVVPDPNNVGRFYRSNSNDGTTWATLDFATAESSPDDMLVPYTLNTQLLMFGEHTTEPYYNSGNADFNLDPIRGARFEWGVQAKNSIIKADNAVYWLARNEQGANIFMRYASNGPQVISNNDINYELDQLSQTSDGIALSYQQLGHTFIEWTFTAGDKTFVYDATENAWHVRESKGLGRHRILGHVHFQDKHIVGDYLSSKFYTLDLDSYTDNGDRIERTRYAQFTHKDRNEVFIHELEIEFEHGVGLTTGQGSDPQAMLQVSKDGGKTWSNEIWRSIGKKGEYAGRARWHQLGRARQWLFKISVTDPVFVTIIGAYAKISEGTH